MRLASAMAMLFAFQAPGAPAAEALSAGGGADIQGDAIQPAEVPDPGPGRGGIVPYAAGFFDRYRPVTARDMVDRVPGFQLGVGGQRADQRRAAQYQVW